MRYWQIDQDDLLDIKDGIYSSKSQARKKIIYGIIIDVIAILFAMLLLSIVASIFTV